MSSISPAPQGEPSQGKPSYGELLETDAFKSNTIDTAWLDGIVVHKSVVITIVPTSAVISAVVFRAYKQMIQGGIANFKDNLGKGQLSTLPLKEHQSIPVDITYADVKYSFRVTPKAPDTMVLKMGAQSIEVRYREQADGSIYAASGVESYQVFTKEEALGLRLVLDGVAVLLPTLYDPRSDITGKLIRNTVEDGASVKKGETFPEAKAMKMIITLNATESGVIKHEGDVINTHEKPAGSIINQGDLLASLTLADPPRDKKIGTFSGTLEYATGEEMVASSATLKRFRKTLKTLELVMDGYVLDAEPAVQAMLSALASVSLPIEEIKDAASALGQKMPMKLDTMMQKVYATTLAEHVNGMESTETANLVTKLRSVVEEFVMSLFESKQANVRIIIAPVTVQIDKYAKGLRENAIDVINPAGNSTVDPCVNCRGAACTCAGRNSMTADDGLREGARQVFEIAIEELFIESKLWNADVKYSFPYEDTAGVPVDEGAKRNGAPLRDIPGLYSMQLVPSHRRELQTAVSNSTNSTAVNSTAVNSTAVLLTAAVSTSTGLLSALAYTAVGRIVLAPGTYFLSAELSITRSVVLEAAVAGSVVLDAQASFASQRRVLNINPGSLGVVQLIGLNITGGNVQCSDCSVRAAET
ncbi:acetyl-coa carboxylase [Chrysochromulina tobinii]|uniref:Acetyl-coa carboxylase n=1 Tax=Chrysochromulina tobinii TaxID=1460289 RepID=A0A0M0JMJ7_9EUKA|nr:acetyl-coa carboxylase [Chrysochromulina tobinii]|eukprot:KOO27806.1 acetyl-coa carboxylase [Chrysochromulina sp. CCMP291]